MFEAGKTEWFFAISEVLGEINLVECVGDFEEEKSGNIILEISFCILVIFCKNVVFVAFGISRFYQQIQVISSSKVYFPGIS
jgi:hypothetical protein